MPIPTKYHPNIAEYLNTNAFSGATAPVKTRKREGASFCENAIERNFPLTTGGSTLPVKTVSEPMLVNCLEIPELVKETAMDIGDHAPDFALPDQSGTTVRLSEVAPRKTLVVFFYPKDGTPVCTMEACSFRDSQHAFAKYDAQVIGISSDGVDSHRGFAAENHLDFPLLSDKGGKVRKLWGVPSTLGVLPGRVTYVLDPEGVVRSVYSAQLEAGKHAQTALGAVKTIHALRHS